MKKIYHLPSTIYHRGFTLIELLVAISIIGVLSSFLLANFVGVRQRARDGVRKSDLRQIQSALELYRSDKGSYLPSTTLTCGCALTSGGVDCTAAPSGTPYMKKIPCDPSSGGPYVYDSPSGNTTYSIFTCLENGNDGQKDPTDVCGGTPVSYTLQNP